MSLTREQLAIRKQRLSATDLGAIFGVNPYKTAADVQFEKLYEMADLEESDALWLGNVLEKPIIDRTARELGLVIEYPMPTVVSATHPLLCATPDAGCALVAMRQDRGIESKTNGLISGFPEEGWGDPGTDEIPDRHKVQTMCQMAVMPNWEFVIVAAVVARMGYVRYEVQRSDYREDIDSILEIAPRWWKKHIVDQDPCTDKDGNPIYPSLETLKRVRRVSKSPRDVPTHIVSAYLAASQAAKEAESKKELTKAALLACIGDGDAAAVGEFQVATYHEQKRKEYTVAASSYRVLRMDKGAAEAVAEAETREKLRTESACAAVAEALKQIQTEAAA